MKEIPLLTFSASVYVSGGWGVRRVNVQTASVIEKHIKYLDITLGMRMIIHVYCSVKLHQPNTCNANSNILFTYAYSSILNKGVCSVPIVPRYSTTTVQNSCA